MKANIKNKNPFLIPTLLSLSIISVIMIDLLIKCNVITQGVKVLTMIPNQPKTIPSVSEIKNSINSILIE